jgi:hypothetical protein
VALFFAMDEYGIRDDAISPGGINRVETAKRKVKEEALQASLRIAALVSDCRPANYTADFFVGWRSYFKRIPGALS